MVDGIMIDAYGQKMPIDQVGISVPKQERYRYKFMYKDIAVEKAP